MSVLSRSIVPLAFKVHEAVNLGSNTVIFEIEGGHKLSGEITVKTSKNADVSLLMASLLNANTTTLKNMPSIEEVNRIIEVLTSIGVSVTWHDNGDTVIKPPKKLKLDHINKTAAEKTRSVIMMMGPLAHLFKNFSITQPGGCKLGARTVRPHL